MSNRLLKIITQGRVRSVKTQYLRLFGRKQPQVLDKIFPNLTANLMKSSEMFIDAVFKNEKKFIQSTSIRVLRNLLFKQMQGLRKSQIQIKRIPIKPKSILQSQNKSQGQIVSEQLTISPYVIFGKSMKDRCEQLQESNYMFSPSIYVSDLQTIMKDRIYGFHCYYTNPNKEYQIIQKSTTITYPSQQFVVTFQTDSIQHQFFIADFNYMLAYEEYENNVDKKA